jgi:hypothetical protein
VRFRPVWAGIAAGAALALCAGAGARVSSSITSLRISGSPAKPIFTITGRGLSVPKPLPAGSPSGQALCPLHINGNAGVDYGDRFYLLAFSTSTGDDKLLYAAGRYRPQVNELDCIGLVVLSQTATKVSFTFGNAYAQYRSQYRTLRNGDVVEVVLNGAAFAAVVRYG